jgi:hypothetical protein
MWRVLHNFLLHCVIAPVVILAPFSITLDPREPISRAEPEAPDCAYEACLAPFPLKKEVTSVGHKEIDRGVAMRFFGLAQQDPLELSHDGFICEQRHPVTNKDRESSCR